MGTSAERIVLDDSRRLRELAAERGEPAVLAAIAAVMAEALPTRTLEDGTQRMTPGWSKDDLVAAVRARVLGS